MIDYKATIFIFVEFVNQLISYPIKCDSLTNNVDPDPMQHSVALDQGQSNT